MPIVVTGGSGFIGLNLRVRLAELGHTDVVGVTRHTSPDDLQRALEQADIVFHLAGANRPADAADFQRVNADLTKQLCDILVASGRAVPFVYASSTQVSLDNAYAASKRAGEAFVQQYTDETNAGGYVFRFPNVFGKWSRPNYNSAVATFCYNLARGLPITVNDPSTPLSLLYVDDAVEAMLRLVSPPRPPSGVLAVGPIYSKTLGEVVELLESSVESRRSLVVPRVGTGFTRALYATYVSFLPPGAFAYPLVRHSDHRGAFVEMLKTPDCGQVSYFTALPGVTRGEHYHHTKSEKFLVVKGQARFGFRHIVTDETFAIEVHEDAARVVETVPGWAHDITNIGASEMIVIVWANETFDRQRPDTIACRVDS